MLFLLFILIQAQEPARLSKLVIAGVSVFLILGICLLVYFIRRLKSSEKEPEEDWSLSRRSLFVEEPPPSEPPQMEEIEPAATEMLASPSSSQTRSLASEPGLEIPLAAEQPEPPLPSAPPVHHGERTERVERGTELLASPQLETPAQVKPQETIGLDEEVLAGLERIEQKSPAPVEPAEPQQTAELRSPSIEHAESAQPEEVEPEPAARVEQRATREFFEPPTIKRAPSREPFEPPVIKPLAPQEQAETHDEQAAPQVTRDLYASGSQSQDLTSGSAASDTSLYGQPPMHDAATERQTSALYESSGTRELAAEPDLSSDIASVPAGDGRTRSVVVSPSAQERRAPAGAVLGLPLEGSKGPMVLGHPVKPADEIGIGSLTSYGKPQDKDGGRGGTVALLLAIMIVGGALAAYFFMPSVHSKVDAIVARLRGVDPNAANHSTEPKVMIFPSGMPERNKDTVKIKGSLNNISNETLENLSIEVKLERAGGAAPEMLTAPITPQQLAPNEHGTYEFEYNDSNGPGVFKYSITKLFSNGNEVRFTSPALK